MAHFKLVPGQVGSGWIGVYVAVDTYYNFEGTGTNICLTAESVNATEVASYIDELIDELQDLKKVAERKFAGWKDR
ncbi:hypothetical protein FHS31_001124 [Sphingomonas vulcanisoli]|uniref:Uncharacterized protein n=1 Tax=Sphingomonas vulcanisoli TaxID=1658060 RepID=A0ABX0TPR4_9SPHN|nr:hypothetical protein [Sphingomonas vulcanisoli]NIJ07528.1 hypothetical protein [Sphingomonas vulcanisoli]